LDLLLNQLRMLASALEDNASTVARKVALAIGDSRNLALRITNSRLHQVYITTSKRCLASSQTSLMCLLENLNRMPHLSVVRIDITVVLGKPKSRQLLLAKSLASLIACLQ